MPTSEETRILVIQKHEISRNMLKYILKDMGFRNVDTSANGRQALDYLGRFPYSILLSEWDLVSMDGLALLRKIRENDEWKGMLFIMVTAEKDRSKVIEAKNSGVDGYLTKPFTAASLYKIILRELKARFPDGYTPAKQSASKKVSGNPEVKIFGEAAPKDAATAKSWSITPRYLNTKSNIIKGAHAALLAIMSPQFDVMEASADFVAISEITEVVQDACQDIARQSEDANRICDVSQDMNKALDVIENATADSPEAKQGMMKLDQSATALGTLLDSFDNDVAEVTTMLSNMESMVRQAHISEINELIKESYALESGLADETALSRAESDAAAEEAAEKLSAIRTESALTCKSITQAAENINHVIERINRPGMAATPLSETFKQLSGRIEHIMEMLDNQMALASTVAAGMQEVAAAPQKVVHPEKADTPDAEDTKTDSTQGCAKPIKPQPQTPPASTPAALRKILDNRILMMDIIKKEHALTITGLTELLFNKADLLQEQIPGSPASGLSKWIDHNIERNDIFYDPGKCKDLSQLRDDIYAYSLKTIELFRKAKKIEALKIFQKVRELSGHIEKILDEMREDLKRRI